MKAVNLTTQRDLASNLETARNMLTRLKGLLGKSSMAPGEALLIKPCNGIHTFGMRFAIDVIFLDRENRVVAVTKDLRPNHLTRLYFRAASVIELPAGTVEATATSVGDEVGIA
jgi:uncharacterized membrane protein (UPF0127 family)